MFRKSLLALGVAGLAFFGASVPAAQAAPVTADAQALLTITPGMKLDVGRDNYGCTMGAVGHDAAGNIVGISAAHCLATGTDVFFPGRRDLGPIGKTVYSHPNGGNIGSEPDYSVVQYDSAKVAVSAQGANIRVDKNGPRPALFSGVCKSGQTTGSSCGVVTNYPPNGNTAGYIFVLPGDSGGPLVYGTTWAGIVSRIDFDLRGPFSFASADRILADMAARGGVGAGFRPGL